MTLLASLAIGIAASAAGPDDPASFYALFYDGAHLTAPARPNEVWSSDEATIAGRRLFGASNPVRLLQAVTSRVPQQGPRVIMANGDMLAGKVVGFLPASPGNGTPARLLISLEGSLLAGDPRGLVVVADRVLRVTTAEEETTAGKPGSLLLADGSRLKVSAMRWSEQGLKALTDRGLITVPFATIRDLTVPKVDLMQAVLDDSFYPPSRPDTEVGRLETLDGAVLTYRCEMILLGVSRAASPTKYLVVQPNWSLGVILVPTDLIWRQSFRSAREVPLSLLPASTISEKVGIHRWPWRRNENVEGGDLACGGITVDLGVGTHSCSEIAFELPPQARDFTTLVGVDQHIGPGACAVCKVYLDQPAGRPLFSSGLLRSGQEPTPVGPLPLIDHRKLVLATEWAGGDRPREAYPLDIGGHVDWLMPFVNIEIDDTSFCQSLRRFLSGCAAWDVSPADAHRVRTGPYWDAAQECWLPLIKSVDARPLRIRRTLSSVSAADDGLELIFDQFRNAASPKIELRIDGELVAPAAVRDEDNNANKRATLLRRPGSPPAANAKTVVRPMAGRGGVEEISQQFQTRTVRWDLQKYHGRTVQLTLDIFLSNQLEGLVWRGLTVMSANGDPRK